MSLSRNDIAIARAHGVSFVCATCDRYWDGRRRRLPGYQCTTTVPCGGPIAGKVFPEYKGPVTDLTTVCFVCGQEATHGVRPHGDTKAVGCCEKHLKLVEEFRLKDTNPPAMGAEASQGGKDFVPLEVVLRQRKRLLSDLLKEADGK